jgi:hypothetical protein
MSPTSLKANFFKAFNNLLHSNFTASLQIPLSKRTGRRAASRLVEIGESPLLI